MKKGILLLCLFMTISFAQAQSAKNLIQLGIKYHDAGDFNKAIKTYKKALKLEPDSDLIHYELSMSYLSNQEYKKAIKNANFVIKKKSDLTIQAYITKGSALDLLGKTKKSISLFNKAIKETEGHFLLYYNLALNYYKLQDLDLAEENALKAIDLNPNHASSHLIIASTNFQKGRNVQTILAAYYFLFLEPTSKRSAQVYEMLHKSLNQGISKDKEKANTINININPDKEDEMSSISLLLALMQARNHSDEQKDLSKEELLINNTKSFFISMQEIKSEENKGIWWDFYTPFFAQVAQSDHIKTFCMYTNQSGNEVAHKWIQDNEPKLEAFADWLDNQ